MQLGILNLGTKSYGEIFYGGFLQVGYPKIDTSKGYWLPSIGNSLSDSIKTGSNQFVYCLQNNSTAKLKFDDTLENPENTNLHTLMYSGIGTYTVSFKVNDTLLQSWNETDSVETTHIRTLTAEQVSLINDNYDSLYIEITS